MSRRFLYIAADAGYFLGHRVHLADAAREAGWTVEVATAPGPMQERLKDRGFAVHAVPIRRFSLNPFGALRTTAALWALIRRRRPEMVHCISLKPMILGGIAARLASVPALVHSVTGLGHAFSEQTLFWRAIRFMMRIGVRLAVPDNARIVFQHDADRVRLARGGHLAERSRTIIGSGVDLDVFSAAPLPEGRTRFLMISRMIHKKGVEDYARAARDLRRRGVEADFALAGGFDRGNPEAIPKAWLEGWRSEGLIDWLEEVDQAEVPGVIAAAHAVVLPSRYGEGVPRCLIEGAACGRALIASDLPGCQEVIEPGENGLLVAVGDVAALAEAMAELAGDRDRLAAFGARGREIAETRFSHADIAARTLTVYEEVAPPAGRTPKSAAP